MDKAKKRFIQTKDEVKITFVPQCTKCKYNINYNSCHRFKEKPLAYMKNEKECPKKEGR